MPNRHRNARQGSARWLGWALAALLAAGCAPRPDAGTAERAIRDHFQGRGHPVREITIGKIRRNPVEERQYMAPLTYVVDVESVTVEAGGAPEAKGRPSEGGSRTFSGATIKLWMVNQPDQRWVMGQISGIDLP